MDLEQMILTPANKWTDPNNRVWTFYRDYNRKWRYIREDWNMSSLAFKSRHEAKLDLLRFFQDE